MKFIRKREREKNHTLRFDYQKEKKIPKATQLKVGIIAFVGPNNIRKVCKLLRF